MLLVLFCLLFITSCSKADVLDKSRIDSAVMTNTAIEISDTLTKDEAESIIESLNK